ncbi:hypothetical protein GCWU000324_03081 [Kingella oralis ATCC 51147]|uniref:Uncharacterized protein n=1 Tax=Kingella oralis ATCC 51147 TaxID=629741 RepID=C4GMZ3_9NEIS|nr:hypothetical protein GCWU000324_03081 [Kingella oralis ATCC 51147]
MRQPENGAVGFQAAVNVCFCKDADYSTWAFSGCLSLCLQRNTLGAARVNH